MSPPVTPTFTSTVLERSCQEYSIFYAVQPDVVADSTGVVYADELCCLLQRLV